MITWELIRNHKSDLMTQEMVLGGFYKYCDMSRYGASFKVPFVKYVHNSGDIYWSKDHMDELRSITLKDEQCALLIEDIESAINSYREYIDSIKDKAIDVEEWIKKTQMAVAPIAYFVFEESVLKRVESEGLSLNDAPKATTDVTRVSSQIAALKTAYPDLSEFGAAPESLAREIEDIVKKYGYLGMKFFGGQPWSNIDVFDMIKNSDVKKGEVVSTSQSNSTLLNYLARLLELRTKQWEAMCYGIYVFRQYVISNYSDKFTYDSLLDLTLEDLANLFKNGFINIGGDRKSFVITVDEAGYKIDFTRELAQKTDEFLGSEIKGAIAFKGKVTGRAKIILSPKDSYKIEKGDILVATMSTPDFLPAMQRAGAFVTDIGGITSHAAIVAREMKKPCIIGTKIATKVLKDGDLVEVDAEKGIVKLIK
ncbi:MAG: hypothetical protein KBD47_00375 [Candidatus Pacebacteria bacterium]|nr:hypothetical protein [Candidatus Paceibacterota bacterium]